MKDCKILIELDCLLDTVMGTIYKIDKDLVLPVLQSGYYERWHNNIQHLCPNIDQEVFKQMYKNRDVETLKCSRPTYLVAVLANVNIEDKIANYEHPKSLKRSYTVNYYPYNLTDMEIAVFKEVLGDALFVDGEIAMVSIPLEKLTPNNVKANYDRLIFYNAEPWITYHREAIRDNPMPLLEVDSGLCCLDDKAGVTTVKINDKVTMPLTFDTLAEQTKMCFGFHLKLDFIPLGDVSIDLRKERYGGHKLPDNETE